MSLISSDQTLASERLRKAIERNRAKQAMREAHARRVDAAKEEKHQQQDFYTGTSGGRTRRGVQLPHQDVEFTTQLKRHSRKTAKSLMTPSLISTNGRKISNRRGLTSFLSHGRENLSLYFSRLGWILCLFLILRLVFSEGGVLDYYRSISLYESREQLRQDILAENQALRDEMERIRTDSAYQRRLLRDHLGHIAADEYLIIFANAALGNSP